MSLNPSTQGHVVFCVLFLPPNMSRRPSLQAPQRRRSSTGNHAESDAALAKLGYQSELPRNLSMLSVLGLSFAIMAVPFGLSTTFYITLTDGQAVTVLYGWILVSIISLSIAASLAEICAVSGLLLPNLSASSRWQVADLRCLLLRSIRPPVASTTGPPC